jgi:hypothetical protein
MSDRRRATRVPASFPVRFGKDPAAEPALLRDISELGLACIAPQAIPEMTLVALDFALPGATELHHVQGAVVRCEPLRGEQRGRFDLAVYFTELQPVTRAALKNYVGKTSARGSRCAA